jgi:hypothetical protein
MRYVTVVGMLMVSAIGAPVMGLAREDTDSNRICYGYGDADRTIAACTVFIVGGFVDGIDLGSAFKIRGNAYDDQGKYR